MAWTLFRDISAGCFSHLLQLAIVSETAPGKMPDSHLALVGSKLTFLKEKKNLFELRLIWKKLKVEAARQTSLLLVFFFFL